MNVTRNIFLFTVTVLSIISLISKGETPLDISVIESDTELVMPAFALPTDSLGDYPESLAFNVDSLLCLWYAQTYLIVDTGCYNSSENPLFSDSIYIKRLQSLPTIIEMPYNQYIRNAIDAYAIRNRNLVSYVLGMFTLYEEIFVEALLKYDLPVELKYLPIIESALKPNAYSRMGAAGMWQFIYSTGRVYGLNVNSLVDDRYDVIKQTDAAARYLRDLFNIFRDWNLAISAYNCGPGNVNKAIVRSGNKRDFWSIYPYLPKETRGYLPAFIAVNYIMTYYNEHNICPMKSLSRSITDTLIITKNIHLGQISHFCEIQIEELRSLNPQYLRDIIPGYYKPYTLTIPTNKIRPFLESEDTLHLYKTDLFFPQNQASYIEDEMTNKITYINHSIKSGETLSSIALKYHTTIKNIKNWNNLSSDKIRAGKTLRIYNR